MLESETVEHRARDGVVLHESIRFDETGETERDPAQVSLQRSLEALLFVASESLSAQRLAKLTGALPIDVAIVLQNIARDYADRGIVLREIAGGYRFASSPQAREAVQSYLLPPKTTLSPAAMESLAIVAYRQPVTKADIEAVRGVNVDSVVATLLDRGFIAEAGKREVAGRPTIYKTTSAFLEAFGLRSLGDLPEIEEQDDGIKGEEPCD
jgi:segregation and condensation protein B